MAVGSDPNSGGGSYNSGQSSTGVSAAESAPFPSSGGSGGAFYPGGTPNNPAIQGYPAGGQVFYNGGTPNDPALQGYPTAPSYQMPANPQQLYNQSIAAGNRYIRGGNPWNEQGYASVMGQFGVPAQVAQSMWDAAQQYTRSGQGRMMSEPAWQQALQNAYNQYNQPPPNAGNAGGSGGPSNPPPPNAWWGLPRNPFAGGFGGAPPFGGGPRWWMPSGDMMGLPGGGGPGQFNRPLGPPGRLGPGGQPYGWYDIPRNPFAGGFGGAEPNAALGPPSPAGNQGAPSAPPTPYSYGAPPWAQALNSGQVLPQYTTQPTMPLPSAQQWQGFSPGEQGAITQTAQSLGIPQQDYLRQLQASFPEWGTVGPATYQGY